MAASARLIVIVALGSAQTLAWASSYYLPAILADRIAGDIGTTSTQVFAAFSASLILTALLGPSAGRAVDAAGGRGVLGASNLILAAGLGTLASAHSAAMLWAAWSVLGVGMAIGLYDTAFAALGRIYGAGARSAITGITLIAGFASTLGWPLTAWGASAIGWRETCLAWAAAHLVLGLPLNLLFLPKSDPAAVPGRKQGRKRIGVDRRMVVLGFAFATSWMVVAAMAVHLPRLLEAAGASRIEAVAAGALIGPSQVAARIAEASLLKRFPPLLSARLCVALHPLGAAAIGLFGAQASSLFAVLHGAGGGILTIVRGTVPLAMFGAQDYGYRLGLLGAPSRIATAAAPLLFAVLIERCGVGALLFSSALDAAALAALCMLPASPPTAR